MAAVRRSDHTRRRRREAAIPRRQRRRADGRRGGVRTAHCLERRAEHARAALFIQQDERGVVRGQRRVRRRPDHLGAAHDRDRVALLAAALAFLPACQSGFQDEIIEDQDRQIAGMKRQVNSKQGELDRTRAEAAELEEQLAFERDRVANLENRLNAMEASAQEF